MTKNILFSAKFKKILCRKAEDMNLKAIYKSYKILSIFVQDFNRPNSKPSTSESTSGQGYSTTTTTTTTATANES